MRDSMVKELTLAAAESRFMNRFSPIYRVAGLFCPFTVKSWVLVAQHLKLNAADCLK